MCFQNIYFILSPSSFLSPFLPCSSSIPLLRTILVLSLSFHFPTLFRSQPSSSPSFLPAFLRSGGHAKKTPIVRAQREWEKMSTAAQGGLTLCPCESAKVNFSSSSLRQLFRPQLDSPTTLAMASSLCLSPHLSTNACGARFATLHCPFSLSLLLSLWQ